MFSPARWIEPLGMAEGMSYLQQGRRRGKGEDWVGGDERRGRRLGGRR